MKNPVISQEIADKVGVRHCIECGEKCQGYGPWQEGFTCNRICEDIKENRPKYPDHQPKE